MVSREAAKELTRKTDQNRKDVMWLYELLEKTDKRVEETHTKLDSLTTEVATLRTDVTTLQTDVTTLRTDVTTIRTDVTTLQADVTTLRTDVSAGFDRLETLIMSPSTQSQLSGGEVRTPQEKRLSVLEKRMEAYSGRTADHVGELRRHESMFDAYDERFDAQDKRFDAHEKRFDNLDSQMAEVLGILRGKPRLAVVVPAEPGPTTPGSGPEDRDPDVHDH